MTNSRFKSHLMEWLQVLEPPEDLNVWQWAEAKRRLSSDVTARPGRYSTEEAPYQREPQESFLDEDVQTTVLNWASRTGKTEIINNLDGYIIDNDPASILVVYPIVESAKKWSKMFFTPMVLATPCLRGKIRANLSNKSGNTILQKRFPGGSISAIGANSPSGFRQVQARVVQCDEIDAMETSAEGDPIILAMKRADNYSNSIQVLSSTPTIKGASRIEAWYERSDQRKWWVPCWKCGKSQLLLWEWVKFPDGPEFAYYECNQCHHAWNDKQRLEAIKAGEWRPGTKKFNGIRGYWLNGIYSPFKRKKGFKSKMHQFAAEFLEAKRQGQEAIRVWMNVFKAESYEYAAQTMQADPIYERREDYKCPPEVCYMTIGADVQGDRIEVEKVGWAPGEESWGLDYRIFEGNPVQKEVWQNLEKWIDEPIQHPSGRELKFGHCFIDSSAFTDDVYRFTRPRQVRGILSIKGSSEPGKPIVERPKKSGKSRTRLILIGTNTAKQLLYARLALEEVGPGFMHYNTGYDLEYFKQLTAEKAHTRFKMGQRYLKFECPPGVRNEALDIRVYATAAFAYARPNLEKLAKEFATPYERPDPKKDQVEDIKKRPVRRSNWANSWNA